MSFMHLGRYACILAGVKPLNKDDAYPVRRHLPKQTEGTFVSVPFFRVTLTLYAHFCEIYSNLFVSIFYNMKISIINLGKH